SSRAKTLNFHIWKHWQPLKMAAFDNVTISEEELEDGYPAESIFSNPGSMGITFDDLIVLPGEITFGVHEVDLNSKVSKNISVSSPFVSSPMDTVTGTKMAIGMALNGGLGIVHYSCPLEEQVKMVRDVKRYENGFILEPYCLAPDATIEDLDALRDTKGISGVPVTADGRVGARLLGMVTKRDTDFLTDRSQPLTAVMTPVAELTCAQHPCDLESANRILKESKKGHLPVIDQDGCLRALTTRMDLIKNNEFPLATKDAATKSLK
ncbi:unnamed protein product, partial [Heterosigma akashiwo]